MSKEHLATYLNDHLAGARTAVETLDRLQKEAPDLTGALAQLKKEIEEDEDQLKTLMRTVGIAESTVRKAGGWIAERATSIKFGIDDDKHGPLRRFERLELVSLGIEGKLSMWKALAAIAANDPTLRIVDYQRLIARGLDQRARVESMRLEAAHFALPV